MPWDLEARYRALLAELDRRGVPYIRSETLDWLTNIYRGLDKGIVLSTVKAADLWEAQFLMPKPGDDHE